MSIEHLHNSGDYGWTPNPAGVRRILATLPAPVFAMAAPHLMGAPAQDVYLYKAWSEALGGKYPDYPAQEIGDCFVRDTLVLMGDGTSKPIQDVERGDYVFTLGKRPQVVSRTIRKPYSGPLITLWSESLGPITATPDHQFWSMRMDEAGNRWTPVGELTDNHFVWSRRRYWDQIQGKKVYEVKDGEVFCLEVEEDFSFIANGYAVHNCTSFGTGHGIDLLQAVQITLGKKAEAWKESCTEALYGEGRELANMLGGGDGCYGGAVAKAAHDIGVVPREVVGAYSGQRAKQWGGSGVPASIKDKGKEHPVETISLVTTWDELVAALSNGYPVTVCSSQGFTLRRDDRGICEAHGRWDHCQVIVGIMWSNTPDECATIANSWSEKPYSGPRPNDLPGFAYNARRPVVEHMLSLQDSWVLSSFQGYPGQPLPSSWSYGGFI